MHLLAECSDCTNLKNQRSSQILHTRPRTHHRYHNCSSRQNKARSPFKRGEKNVRLLNTVLGSRALPPWCGTGLKTGAGGEMETNEDRTLYPSSSHSLHY